jgi:hypothetical protein
MEGNDSGGGSLYKYLPTWIPIGLCTMERDDSGEGALYKYHAVRDRFRNTTWISIGLCTMETAVIPIELGVDFPAIRYFE